MKTWRIELSYDADSDYYKPGNDLRINLIKFLLKKQAYRIRSYVGSTIAFTCELNESIHPLTFWEEKIVVEFGNEFYYMISVIMTEGSNPDFAMRVKSKVDFELNFQIDVQTAKTQLDSENIKFRNL